MRGWRGSARAISRKTVRPPTPESKTPIGAGEARFFMNGATSRRGRLFDERAGAALALDVVLLDLLVEIRARRVDRLRGLRNVPPVLAQLGQDERLLRLVLELLPRFHAHGRGDALSRVVEV